MTWRPLDAESRRNLRVVTRSDLAAGVGALSGVAAAPAPPPSWVYFVRSGAAGPIKIGYARDPYTRFMNLRTASPDDVAYLGHFPGGIEEEHAVHERFAHLRIRGEWFRAESELLTFIAEQRFDADA